MKLRRAAGITLLLSFVFGFACGVDDTEADSTAGTGNAPSGRCGDGECGANETRLSCPADCASGGRAGGGGRGGSGGTSDGGVPGSGGNSGRDGGGAADSGASGADGAISGGAAGGGGRGGNGGLEAGAAGAGEAAGDAGAGSGTRETLGGTCVSDGDCAGELKCLQKDALRDGTGPANGVCTLPCMAVEDCQGIDANAVCLYLSLDEAFCTEGCTPGVAEAKCHGRADAGCFVADSLTDGTYCDAATREGCAPEQICLDTGICVNIRYGCVFACRGDFDCAPGFCNFSTGLCSLERPTGLPLGSACATHAPDEPDPCNGYCFPEPPGSDGVCRGPCIKGRDFTGCGWDGHGPADAACIFNTDATVPAEGDWGFCTGLCDCNADCPAEGDYCMDDPAAGAFMSTTFDRRGYCRTLNAGETLAQTIQECAGGTGGAGGQGN